MTYILVYLTLINLTAFLLFGIDKRKAIKQKYRIPERQLFLYAVLGGAAGALAGMRFFRHKTLHKKFVWGIPLLLAIQTVAFVYFATLHLRWI